MRVMTVAKSTPQAREIAIGKKGAVAGVLVDMSGISPTKVVTDVKMMGRKRTVAAPKIASTADLP